MAPRWRGWCRRRVAVAGAGTQCVGEEHWVADQVSVGQASRLLGEPVGPFQAGAVHPRGCTAHDTGREVEEPPDAKTDARTGAVQMAHQPLLLARLTECHHQDTRAAGANAVHDGVALAVGEVAVLGANHAETRDALAESLRSALGDRLASRAMPTRHKGTLGRGGRPPSHPRRC
jgi:hypothetical protein